MVYCAYVKKNVFCKSEFEEEIMMIAILGASTFSVVIILSYSLNMWITIRRINNGRAI